MCRQRDQSWYENLSDSEKSRFTEQKTEEISTEDLPSENPIPGKADRMGPKETIGDRLWSVGKGALIAAAGAALFYLTEWTSGQDFGPWGELIAAGLAVVTNAVRKLGTNW